MGDVGRMNEKIILLTEVSTRNTTDGSYTNTWTTLASVWAERVGEETSENVIKNKMTLETTIRLRIRYRKDIEPNYRVTYRSENYRIIGIKETDRKFYMELKIAILN